MLYSVSHGSSLNSKVTYTSVTSPSNGGLYIDSICFTPARLDGFAFHTQFLDACSDSDALCHPDPRRETTMQINDARKPLSEHGGSSAIHTLQHLCMSAPSKK